MSGHNMLHQAFYAPHQFPDPGDGEAIVVDRTPCLIEFRTAAAETRTLPNPTLVGIRIVLAMTVDGGDCVVTAAAAINAAGNTIMTFGDVRDIIELVSVKVGSDLRWQILSNQNVALS